MSSDPLVDEYVGKIEPLLPLARRAFGSRGQDSPNHAASREYTALLAEFKERGGNLQRLAGALGVEYSGVRRRIVMRNVSVSEISRTKRPRNSVSAEELDAVASRIKAAKEINVEAYHDALRDAYVAGIPMATLAAKLNISSAAPLYYGVARSQQRMSTV